MCGIQKNISLLKGINKLQGCRTTKGLFYLPVSDTQTLILKIIGSSKCRYRQISLIFWVFFFFFSLNFFYACLFSFLFSLKKTLHIMKNKNPMANFIVIILILVAIFSIAKWHSYKIKKDIYFDKPQNDLKRSNLAKYIDIV